MDKVQHFEVPADDMARAKKFYSKVFGWTFKDYPMPDLEYSAVYTTEVDEKTCQPKEVGSVNGGLLKRGGAWDLKTPTVAVVVQDLKKSIKTIKAAGGAILMEPANVGGMGLYAYIKDTEGNTIGVWQNLKQPETKSPAKKKTNKK
jgi:predicted enzyme related to lactoylglutathione lyase